MADPDLVGLLRIPGQRGLGAVDLVLERVLPARTDLRDGHGTARATVEPKQDRSRVLRRDRPGDRVRGAFGRKGLDRAGRFVARVDEGREVGQDLDDVLPRDVGHQVHPVRPDVADGPQRATAIRLEAPVPVALEQEPVLEVVAGHQPDVTERPGRHGLPGVLVERVVADVEVRRVDQAGRGREFDESGGPVGGHPQRLLAHDVAARGEDRPGLRDMEVVGGGHMDDLDRRVREQVVEGVVGAGHSERGGALRATRRGAAQDTTDIHADAPERLHVDGPDEARADDGRADVGDPPHAQSTHPFVCTRPV